MVTVIKDRTTVESFLSKWSSNVCVCAHAHACTHTHMHTWITAIWLSPWYHQLLSLKIKCVCVYDTKCIEPGILATVSQQRHKLPTWKLASGCNFSSINLSYIFPLFTQNIYSMPSLP